MKRFSAASSGILTMAIIACMVCCSKDYNPFENISNAQVHIALESCSKRIRNNDTLLIFSTETLSVYTTVREKIDSIRFHADGNRLQNDMTFLPPFTSDNIDFLFSFADTGKHTVSAVAYRSDKSTSAAGPLSFVVKSPLKQDSIFSVFGGPVSLATDSVDDNDVLYWWSFGLGVGDTIYGPFCKFKYPSPDNIVPGKKATGYLWVTDLKEKDVSPISSFSYEFYRAAAPVIKCTSQGYRNKDTVASGDTLVFSIKVTDSSGVGLNKVLIDGAEVSAIAGGEYSTIYTGIKKFSGVAPKTVTVLAINNVNDTTSQSFYCFYEPTNILPTIVKLGLINPSSSISTRLNYVTFVVSVAKLTKDTVNVRVLQNGQLVKTQAVTDSVKVLFWDLNQLVTGANVIETQALIRSQKYADTSITITQVPSFTDVTPPQIVSIFINKKLFTGNPFTLAATDQNFAVTVMTFDNESGIASVKLRNKLALGNIAMTDSLALHAWVSDKITMPANGVLKQSQVNLILTVTNNANLTITDTITVKK